MCAGPTLEPRERLRHRPRPPARPTPLRVDRGGIDARHVEDVLEQARQAIELLQCQLRLSAPLLGRQAHVLKIRHRHTDRRHGRAQVVAEGGEERRRQVGALAQRLCLLALGKEMRALDRDRHDPAKRVERTEIERRGLGRQNAHGFRAESQRHERHPALARLADLDMAAVRPLTRVVLERAVQPRERHVQLIARWFDGTLATLVHLPAGRSWQADRDGLELETAGDVPRHVGNRAARCRLSAGCRG